jgi:hypothetical protein
MEKAPLELGTEVVQKYVRNGGTIFAVWRILTLDNGETRYVVGGGAYTEAEVRAQFHIVTNKEELEQPKQPAPKPEASEPEP